MIRNIVLIPNRIKDVDLKVTKMLAQILSGLGFNLYVEENYADLLSVSSYKEFPRNAELIIVAGGDGSIIDAAKYALEHDIPLVGINLGKVGYLAEVNPNSLELFKRLNNGDFSIEERMLLEVDATVGGEFVKGSWYAVNDVVISHDDFLGIREFQIENSKGEGIVYRADGVIVSTPIGSTAYSLSAGGPLISHDVDSILVTPICPHSFFNRSIIFSSGDTVNVANIGSEKMNVSIDGRLFFTINSGDRCTIRSSKKRLKTLTFTKNNMFTGLFNKMRIAEDVK